MKKKGRGRKGPAAVLLVLTLITAFALYGVINARTVRVVYGEASLKGLDYRLDGVKILYVSDLKLSSVNEAKHAVKLLKRLSELAPDVILIGGDITSYDLLSSFRLKTGINTETEERDRLLSARDEFLRGVSEISVPVSIFAVTGDKDLPLTQSEKSRTKVYFLEDKGVNLNIRGATLPLYGTGSATFNLTGSGTSPMIIMFHDPSLYGKAALRASERSPEAGSYLLLSAHTLGGQVRIGNMFAYQSDLNRRYTLAADSNGIYSDGSNIKMLISSGIGSELIPFRIGTTPKAYLITLRAAS